MGRHTSRPHFRRVDAGIGAGSRPTRSVTNWISRLAAAKSDMSLCPGTNVRGNAPSGIVFIRIAVHPKAQNRSNYRGGGAPVCLASRIHGRADNIPVAVAQPLSGLQGSILRKFRNSTPHAGHTTAIGWPARGAAINLLPPERPKEQIRVREITARRCKYALRAYW